jgi:hypothetical protein
MDPDTKKKVSQTNRILADYDARYSKVDDALMKVIDQTLIANAITMTEITVNFSRWFEEQPERLFKLVAAFGRNVSKVAEARMTVGLARSIEYRDRCRLDMEKAKARLERELARKKAAEEIAAIRRSEQAKTNTNRT